MTPGTTISGLDPLSGPVLDLDQFPFDRANGPSIDTLRASAAALRRLANAGQFVDARDFAIDPTGNNDSSVAINAGLVQAIAANLPLKLPPGIFALASVPVGYNVLPYQGGQFALFGAGGMGAQFVSGYNLPTPRGHLSLGFNTVNTVLIEYTGVLPAFIANCVNGAWLKDIGLLGINVAPPIYGVPINSYAAYLSAGIRGGPSYPNSPNCAIAIDPLIKTAPADGGYPGLVYANSFGSNLVLLENVPVQGFAVDLALSTSGAVAENGSSVICRNVTLSGCDTAVAIGQSQSRLFSMTDGGIGNCRIGVDGFNFGNGQGCPPSRFTGLNFGFIYALLNSPNAFGSCTFEKCYAESIRKIGLWGNGPSPGSSGLSFEGGDYLITQADEPSLWPPPPLITLESYGTTKVEKGAFGLSTQSANNPVLNLIGGISPIVLDAEVIGAGNQSNPNNLPFVGYNKNMTSQVVMRECQALGRLMSDIYPRSYGLGSAAYNGRIVAPWNTRFIPDGAAEYAYVPGTGLPEIQVNGCSNITLNLNAWPTPSSLTFNCTNYLAFQPGDVLYWLAKAQLNSLEQYVVPALLVTSVNAGSQLVTCALLFDPLDYDSVANWNVYQAGSMFVAPNRWAPRAPFLAACNGTTALTITNAAQYNVLQNGDWLFDSAGHMGAYARVVSGAGTANIVMNVPAIGSGPTELFFDRLYPLMLGAPI